MTAGSYVSGWSTVRACLGHLNLYLIRESTDVRSGLLLTSVNESISIPSISIPSKIHEDANPCPVRFLSGPVRSVLKTPVRSKAADSTMPETTVSSLRATRERVNKMTCLEEKDMDRQLLHKNNYSESQLSVKQMKGGSKHLTSYEGRFVSPLANTGILPEESRYCRFHLHLPADFNPSTRVCLLFAPTGDHSFWRRYRFLSYPLAREYGIGSVVVENPFYGSRKPKNQTRSGIRQVSDLFTMGSALILEGGFLLNWLQDEHGFSSLGISGVSLGGHNVDPMLMVHMTAGSYVSGWSTVRACLGHLNLYLIRESTDVRSGLLLTSVNESISIPSISIPSKIHEDANPCPVRFLSGPVRSVLKTPVRSKAADSTMPETTVSSLRATRERVNKMTCLEEKDMDRQLLHKNNYSESQLSVKQMKGGSKHLTSYEGRFVSPLANTGILPEESRYCRFHLHLPADFNPSTRVCLLFAPTGDHSFWRRYRFLSYPLAREYGIGSVVVENPFYGSRKPKNQTRSGIRQVSDLFTMGSALILEGGFLLNWLQDEHGFSSLGISGVSLGGHNASLTAAVYQRPLATIPCLSWSTAAHTFSDGIISSSCMWSVLRDQLSPEKVAEIKEVVRLTDNEILQLLESGEVKEKSSGAGSLVSKILHSDRLTSLTSSLGGAVGAHRISNLTNSIGVGGRTASKDRTTSLYMRLLIDEFSNLKNYPTLARTESAVVVVAEEDLYVTRPSDDHMIQDISEIWPGCEVRVVKGGHITSYLTHNGTFRSAISDAFDRLEAGVKDDCTERTGSLDKQIGSTEDNTA
eukprot:sb/3462186/